MMQVWDSGDMIAKQQIELYPETFNANSKPDKPSEEAPRDLMDERSVKHVSTSTISCSNVEFHRRCRFIRECCCKAQSLQ